MLRWHCIFSAPLRKHRPSSVSLNTGLCWSLQPLFFYLARWASAVCFYTSVNSRNPSGCATKKKRKVTLSLLYFTHLFPFSADTSGSTDSEHVRSANLCKSCWLKFQQPRATRQMDLALLLPLAGKWCGSGFVLSSDAVSIAIRWQWVAWPCYRCSSSTQSSYINRGEQQWRRTSRKHTRTHMSRARNLYRWINSKKSNQKCQSE